MVVTVIIGVVIALVAVGAAFLVGIDAGASAVAGEWLRHHPEDEHLRFGDGRSRLPARDQLPRRAR